MVKRPILCLVAVVSAFAITAVPAQAGGTTSVSTFPASTTISPSTKLLIQACVGEPVVFSGDSLVVVHETTLPDGSQQTVVHRNGKGAVATGATTGATYRIGGADTFVEFTAPSGTFVSTFGASIRVTGPGGGPGFRGHILFHLTVDPEGNVGADVEIIDITCT
jgi:hypothetical protein